MAVFKCEKYPNLRVSGAGKFADGSLEVSGEAVEKVRRLVDNEAFGITEEKAKPAPKTTKATPAKADEDNAGDKKPADDK